MIIRDRVVASARSSRSQIILDGDDEGLQKLRNQTHHRTVPQVFIGDEFIGGFDDLKALEASGELDKKLQS